MAIPKLVKHFFISGLVRQTSAALKKVHPNNNYGKLLQLSFIALDNGTVTQRMVYENYKGDELMNEKEQKNLEKLLSINVDKEMKGDNDVKKPCKYIVACIDTQKQTIIVDWKYKDGTNKILNL